MNICSDIFSSDTWSSNILPSTLQNCRSSVGKKCRSAAQPAERIQDPRSEMRIGLIKNDILSSDILRDILQNCRSVKQAIRNDQDRTKTDRNITIRYNDASESGCGSDISVSTNRQIELKRIGNLPVLDPRRFEPRALPEAVGTALGTVRYETIPIPEHPVKVEESRRSSWCSNRLATVHYGIVPIPECTD